MGRAARLAVATVAVVAAAAVVGATLARRGGDGGADAVPAHAATASLAARLQAPAIAADAPLGALTTLPEVAPGALPGRLLIVAGCRLRVVELATLVPRELGSACAASAAPGGRFVIALGLPDGRGSGGRPLPGLLRLIDLATGRERARPRPCDGLRQPAVDDRGLVLTCDRARRPVAIALDGSTRRIAPAAATLALPTGMLLLRGGRLEGLDATPPYLADDARALARSPDGALGVLVGGPAAARLLVGSAAPPETLRAPSGAVGTPFALAPGGTTAWLRIATGAVRLARRDGGAAHVSELLRDWPATPAPDGHWVAVAQEEGGIVIGSLEPLTPRYRLPVSGAITSLVWLPFAGSGWSRHLAAVSGRQLRAPRAPSARARRA